MGDGLVSWGNGQPHFKETTGSIAVLLLFLHRVIYCKPWSAT